MDRYSRAAEREELKQVRGDTPTTRKFTGEVPRCGRSMEAIVRQKDLSEGVLAKPVPIYLNAKEYVRRMTPEALKKYEELRSRGPVELPKNADRKFLKRLAEREDDSPKYHIRTWKESGGADSDFYEFVYALGRNYLPQNEWVAAYECFYSIIESYLQGESYRDIGIVVSQQLAEKTLADVRIISTVWMLAHATEVGGLNLKPFEGFLEGYRGVVGRVPWSALVVSDLIEKVGKLEDLPILSVIGRNCWESALEGYCTNASNFIRIHEGVRFALSGMDREQREELGLANNELTDEQLVYRISFVMKELGLGRLLAEHPAMSQFGQGIYGYVDGIFESKAFQKMLQGLDQPLKLDSHYFGSGIDSRGLRVSKEFLLDNGFAQESAPNSREYHLTEKGKIMITEIFYEIKELDVKVTF